MPNPDCRGALSPVDHNQLKALSRVGSGSYSLVELNDGGVLELIGYRFKDLL